MVDNKTLIRELLEIVYDNKDLFKNQDYIKLNTNLKCIYDDYDNHDKIIERNTEINDEYVSLCNFLNLQKTIFLFNPPVIITDKNCYYKNVLILKKTYKYVKTEYDDEYDWVYCYELGDIDGNFNYNLINNLINDFENEKLDNKYSYLINEFNYGECGKLLNYTIWNKEYIDLFKEYKTIVNDNFYNTEEHINTIVKEII